MKRIAFLATLAFASPAFAQQTPPPPSAAVIQEVSQHIKLQIGDLTIQSVQLSAELNEANAKIADLQKQIDALKPKVAPPPAVTEPPK